MLVRFEWPNGDEYTGQYINGKRNGLGDMQVLNCYWKWYFHRFQSLKFRPNVDVFSTAMAMSTRELGEMGSTTVRLVDELHEACLQHFSL